MIKSICSLHNKCCSKKISIFHRVESILRNGENISLYQHFLHFSQCVQGPSPSGSIKVWTECLRFMFLYDVSFSIMKEFADDNFKFDKNGRKLLKWVKNTVGKRRNCSLRVISPFPTVFSKGLFPRGIKRCHCVGMG